MVIYMNDKKIQTTDDIRTFLDGTADVKFLITGKDDRYLWIQQTLVRFRYLSLGRNERGLVLRYLEYSKPFRPLIPTQTGHPFQFYPATDSNAFRPPLTEG